MQREIFQSGLGRTTAWYLGNEPCWRAIQARGYAGQRLGLEAAG